MSSSNYKRCPNCDERLLAAAVKCPKCKIGLRRTLLKPKKRCTNCDTEISSSAERCKNCYNAQRVARTAEQAKLQRQADEAKKAAEEAQRLADEAAQRIAEEKAAKLAEAKAQAERRVGLICKRRERLKAERRAIIPKSYICLLQSSDDPCRWEPVTVIDDAAAYTQNRITVTFNNYGGHALDVMAHNIEPEALQAGLAKANSLTSVPV